MWKTILQNALREDRAEQDVSTAGLGISGESRFVLWSKAEGVFCGSGLVEALREWGLSPNARSKDGLRLIKGEAVCEVEGDARTLLAVERSFLNLLGYASGIATHVRKVVDRVEERAQSLGIPAPRVLATRKTHPGLRDLALLAVQVGGGAVHRRDLASGVLVKDNHLKILGGIDRIPSEAMRGGMLEVSSLEEARQASRLPLRGLLLDNFAPERLRETLDWIARHQSSWEVEVSGNIVLENVRAYVLPGVGRISLGELTHTVRIFDFSFKAV